MSEATATPEDTGQTLDAEAVRRGQEERLEKVWETPKGWRYWSAVNNTEVGIWYTATSFAFMLFAGVLGLMVRVQLAVPENDFLTATFYNQVFTLHGTVMMFLFAVPAVEALGVLLLPQMLGARDLPFPRLSAFGYWCFLIGGVFVSGSIFFGAAPEGGWFMYPPLTSMTYSPGINADFWLLGIGFIEISAIAGAIEIIDPVKPFTFKTPHTDRMACQKIFEDMQKRQITTIGMISGTDGFGASMQAQCKDVVGEYGLTVAADETYNPTDADMTTQLTKIRNTEGVQAVLNPGFGQGPSIVTRNYRQLAIDLPLYQSHGVASDGFIELAGAEAAEGVRLPGTALLIADQLGADDPQKPVVDAYKSAFEEKTGTSVGTFGGYAHDAFLILTDAITRAGSAEPQAIRDAIESTSGLAGTTGIYNMSAEDHLGLDLSAFRMLQIKGGEWTVVE